jgi:hypothetical protein
MLCKSKTRSGARCQVAARPSGYCFAHDPKLATKARAARVLGGLNRRRKLPSDGRPAPKVESLADVLLLLNSILEDIWAMESGSERRARLLLACADSCTKLLAVKAYEHSGSWRDIAERHGLDPEKVLAAVGSFRSRLVDDAPGAPGANGHGGHV